MSSDREVWPVPSVRDRDLIERLRKDLGALEGEAADEIERLRDALTQITYGEGRYNTDQLTHAENTIEDMIGLAQAALEGDKK